MTETKFVVFHIGISSCLDLKLSGLMWNLMILQQVTTSFMKFQAG